MRVKSLLFLCALILIGSTSFADPENSVTANAPAPTDNRMATKLGAYIGILGDPSPTVVGINAAYNLKDWLRLHAGYGQVQATTGVTIDQTGVTTQQTTMTTLGFGALGMVPGWNLTPMAGLSYSHVFFSGDGDFNVNPDNIYATIGVDWQSRTGFNIGVGINEGFTAKASNGGFLNLGWFFL